MSISIISFTNHSTQSSLNCSSNTSFSNFSLSYYRFFYYVITYSYSFVCMQCFFRFRSSTVMLKHSKSASIHFIVYFLTHRSIIFTFLFWFIFDVLQISRSLHLVIWSSSSVWPPFVFTQFLHKIVFFLFLLQK